MNRSPLRKSVDTWASRGCLVSVAALYCAPAYLFAGWIGVVCMAVAIAGFVTWASMGGRRVRKIEPATASDSKQAPGGTLHVSTEDAPPDLRPESGSSGSPVTPLPVEVDRAKPLPAPANGPPAPLPINPDGFPKGTVWLGRPHEPNPATGEKGGQRQPRPPVPPPSSLPQPPAPSRPDVEAGQGRGLSSKANRAIELCAMARAMEYYEAQGYRVQDVSNDRRSFDLLCQRPDRKLRVEVKGTTGDASSVLITANEARHARKHHLDVALFVVYRISLFERDSSTPTASGGFVRILDPWHIDSCLLEPTAYRCVLPPESRDGQLELGLPATPPE